MIRLDISLGGQRCKQLLRVKLKSVDVDNGTVLLLDGKGNRPQPREHRLPLTPFARADVEWLMDRARKLSSPHLFTNSTTKNAMQSEEVSKAVRQINKELLGSQRISSPFTYGDIRRTIETTLASMGVSKDIRAQIQSHGLGGIQARHYDRYDYMAEKRSALLMWSDFLQSLL